MTQTTDTPRRIRSRRLMVEPEVTTTVAQPVATETTVAADPPMRELLRDYFVANKLKNASNRAAERAKELLHKRMLEGGVRQFQTQVQIDGSTAVVEARIFAPEKEMISVEKLRTLVDDATFMKIVSATKQSVTAYAGSNVVVASTVSYTDDETLSIKEIKV